ncbi:hypothetical protein LCGC14_2706110, partial [marine sediment metagenome]
MPRTRTISQLQKELAARQAQVRKLQSRRASLAKRLDALERQIAVVTGTGRAVKATKKKKAGRRTTAKKVKRAKNKQSLANVLAQVLKGKKGVKIPEAVKLVLGAGYTSTSKQFQAIVN